MKKNISKFSSVNIRWANKCLLACIVFLWVISNVIYAQKYHLAFPNHSNNSLDYVRYRITDKNTDTTIVRYNGFGFRTYESLSIVELFLRKSPLFIGDVTDFAAGFTVGSRKIPGKEDYISTSASILLGMNFSIAASLEISDELEVGASYTIFGGNYITDLEYNFNTLNIGVLNLRARYDVLMAQFGISTIRAISKNWYSQISIVPDPEDSQLSFFLRIENNKREDEDGKNNVIANHYSLGVGIKF